jgi:hypothetical protein
VTEENAGNVIAESMLEPIGAVLEPLGYRLADVVDNGDVAVIGVWESSSVRIVASFEPREDIGSVSLARRLDTPALYQPPWTYVELADVLAARGAQAFTRPQHLGHVTTATELRAWATVQAKDLLRVGDLLAGDNLDAIDKMAARRPSNGVAGAK